MPIPGEKSDERHSTTDERCGAKRERRFGEGSENWKPLTRSINHLGALLIASCGLGQSD